MAVGCQVGAQGVTGSPQAGLRSPTPMRRDGRRLLLSMAATGRAWRDRWVVLSVHSAYNVNRVT